MSDRSRFDFTAWLETKNPDETYNFSDCCGHCLMGQYMHSKGESWNMPRYGEYVTDVLGQANVSVLSLMPQTFGHALARVRELEDA